jgi:hypothetical protein
MDNIQLHAGGRTNHLKALKEKYNQLKAKIRSKEELSMAEKKAELEKASRSLKSAKRDAKKSFY